MTSERMFWAIMILLTLTRILMVRSSTLNGFVTLKGTIANDPTITSYSQGIEVENVFMFVPRYPELFYGDLIVVEGVAENNVIKKGTIIEYSVNNSYLYKIRRRLISFYNSALPKPHSSLVAGMVIGTKSLISKDVWESFKRSGTAHVVVASGMNISMVANFSLSLLIKIMKRRYALIITLVFIWIYTIIAGLDAPIVRAALMASIAFFGVVMGRMTYTFRIFIVTGLLMLIFKPHWIYDLGFLLSFVATGSLLFFEVRIRKLLTWIPSFVREDLSTTLAAQIGVTPILYFAFGSINLHAPLANILVLWTVVPLTILGMLAGLVSLLSISIATWILYLVYPLTSWFYLIVSQF